MKKILLISGLLLSAIAYTQGPASVFVYFDFNRYELTHTSRARLDSLTDSLDLSDRIELHGHCDAKGSDAYNIRLSAQRVMKVEQYLLGNGWEHKDIAIVEGHGESMPLNDNGSESDRQLNRRVEIRILRGAQTQVQTKPSLKEQLDNKTLKTGDNIILQNIHFKGAMHQLMPESAATLQELLDAMRSHPTLVIRIEGHICCQMGTGDARDIETGEYDLSEARAKAITEYLIENRIDKNRISYKGYGHSAPLYPYPEKNEEEQRLNRRVEIKIISK
ncbi:MAG TPA: OmpA family protein [Chitinophagaceae bacterium]|nr:OmpA family protein [Chitinophagaceae bacterium]